MTAPNASPFSSWHSTLSIPWLVAGPNGQAESVAWPLYMDALLGQLLAARYASLPSKAPADALAHIGGDRQLEQGPLETNASFVIRLKDAWAASSRAGTAVELLAELYYGGFPGAVIAQQNGLLYNLTGAPTPGVDPTPLLNIALAAPNWSIAQKPGYTVSALCTVLGALGTAQFTVSVNGVAIATGVTPAASASGTLYPVVSAYTWIKFPSATYAAGDLFTINPDGTVPSATGGFVGATWSAAPWWTIDADNTHTSRFVVLFVDPLPSVFSTVASVTFDGTQDYVDVTWPSQFADSTYQVSFSATTTDGSSPVIYLNTTSRGPATCRVYTTARFAGQVDLQAWQLGANPFADLHPVDLARLRRLINRWRPAKATCGGIYAVVTGPVWGYPVNTVYGASALKWGTSISVKFGA